MTSPPASDRELLSRLRAGEAEAFESIFRRWYAPLVRLAESTLHERATAEEVVQDVMLELWKRRAHLEIQSTVQAYLYQATRNRALNHIRHRQVRQRSLLHLVREEGADPSGPSRAVAAEMRAAAMAALDGLPPRCREVFELSRVHGLRYTEIAEVLGVSVKAVEAQMTRALREFRERLAPWL